MANVSCDTAQNTSWLEETRLKLRNYYTTNGFNIRDVLVTYIACKSDGRLPVDGKPQINVTLIYNTELNSQQETQVALLIQRFNDLKVDNAILYDSNNTIPLSDNACVLYNQKSVCVHGVCEVINDKPTCKCYSFLESGYGFTGTYCTDRVNFTTSSTKSPSVSDSTTLIVSIVLPIIAFLTLLVITAIIVYFCCKRRLVGGLSEYREQRDDDDKQKGGIKIPRILNVLQNKTAKTKEDTGQISDFEFDDMNEATGEVPDLIDFTGFEVNQSYRPGYQQASDVTTFRKQQDNDFFKALEDNATQTQRSTIYRTRNSLLSNSTFFDSLPTAYHEKTTPYNDFANAGDDFDNDITFNGLTDNDDDDFSEVIEAINPNVKIPRPKVQPTASKLFKPI